MLVKSNTIFAGHFLKLNFWSMQCLCCKLRSVCQNTVRAIIRVLRVLCLLPRPSSETLAVSNPLKDICFENLPENLPRSIRDLARDLRPAEKPHIGLYRTQEIKPKSGFLWHKAKDYLKRSISQWDKSKCRCKDTMQKRLNHKEVILTFKGALRKMKCFCVQNLPLSLFDYQQREEFWGPRLRHLLVCFQRRYFYVCSRSKPKAL